MSSEANKLGDTYLDAGSDSDEGQQAMDDIDAFERRLRGEAAPAAALKTAAGARVNKPKQQEQRKPASKSGASYVQAAHAAVKPAPVSEKEEAAVEGRRMVAELDDFDADPAGLLLYDWITHHPTAAVQLWFLREPCKNDIIPLCKRSAALGNRLANSLQQRPEEIHGGERVRVALAERRFAALQRAPKQRLRLRVLAHVSQQRSEAV